MTARTCESVCGHDPRHAVSSDPVTAVAKLSQDARRSIAVARTDMDLFGLIKARVVIPFSLTGLVVQPRVVGGTGKINDASQIADGVFDLVVVDEAAAGHRSVSFAK